MEWREFSRLEDDPAREEGVQMETRSRCASRSGEGPQAPANDLCSLLANLVFVFERIKLNPKGTREMMEPE